MPMTLTELERKVERLERELADARGSLEHQRSVLEIRQAIAEIDTDPGVPAEEFFATFKRRREDEARER